MVVNSKKFSKLLHEYRIRCNKMRIRTVMCNSHEMRFPSKSVSQSVGSQPGKADVDVSVKTIKKTK